VSIANIAKIANIRKTHRARLEDLPQQGRDVITKSTAAL
jgi:hypothetical protein